MAEQINKESFLRSAAVFTLLGFVPMISGFLLTPVYTKYLSPGEYGTLAMANVIQSYLSIFIALGFDAAFTRFFIQQSPKPKLSKAVFSTTILTLLGLGAIVMLLLFLVDGPWIRKVVEAGDFTFRSLGWIVESTTLLTVLYIVMNLFNRDRKSLTWFSLQAVFYFVLVTAGSYLGIVTFDAGVEGSLLGKLAGTGITTIIFLLIYLSWTGIIFRLKIFKRMLVYAWPLLLYGLLGTIFDTLDRMSLDKGSDKAELGIYNLALVIASVTGLFINSMQNAISPDVMRLFFSQDKNKHALINEHYRVFLGLSLLLTGACILLAYPFIAFAAADNYLSAIFIVPLLAGAFIPRAYYILFSNPIFFHGNTRLLPLINAGALMAGALLYYFFGVPYGIIGIASCAAATRIFQTILTYLVVRREGWLNNTEYSFGIFNLAAVILIGICWLGILGYPDKTEIYKYGYYAICIMTFAGILILRKRIMSFLQRLIRK
jgi:O-antigen/teichoic acid export membrane protein